MTITPFATSRITRRALLIKTGQTVSYAAGDDGDLELGESHNYEILTTGQYSGTTDIVLNGKTDTHSNNCVKDHATGFMWSRVFSVGVGPTSNGLLAFSGASENYFLYKDAANTANLGGHTDWFVPNRKMVLDMLILAAPASQVDATAFPAISSAIATSTTAPNVTTSNEIVSVSTSGLPAATAKTGASARVWLVRRF